MKILRWLFFLPIGFVLMGIAQFAVGFVAERTSFWVGAPLILFFGVLIVAASMIPCRIAPNPKVGATILLTLFVLFELLSLYSFLPSAHLFPAVARLYADVALVLGGVIGAHSEPS